MNDVDRLAQEIELLHDEACTDFWNAESMLEDVIELVQGLDNILEKVYPAIEKLETALESELDDGEDAENHEVYIAAEDRMCEIKDLVQRLVDLAKKVE